ncbi:MAG: hypothetical protein A3A97_04530 [Candidatus Terrybacteria bacterium RIFCSPLOWO2_01_FULL_40_23]|uniref:Uncharacterized protein n=1 Tax=Candidatus Terrybacteria bacterium RIFCSPLOWO2_01_FULL_40_23 TaxID=1802366 RepID=A0A1G2PUZ6_9BACT|nr:MAG: hypothetical protein A3A97_04530 [Candidatus Terrybacteria bacterium RIFCSPLOWO2_01_FULL_40_23]
MFNTTYPATVNYKQSLADMIAAVHCDWVDPFFDGYNLPIQDKDATEVAIQLIHFNKDMSSKNILDEFDKRGLRPATLPELLSFSVAYPGIAWQFPVVALGSVVQHAHDIEDGLMFRPYEDGHLDVPRLWNDFGNRCLRLRCFEGDWYGYYRFAAISK